MRNVAAKKNNHVIWVCPSSKHFFRSKGEVKCRPSSVIPKLVEHGLKINILIPYDASLLPKTRLASGRITKHTVQLAKKHPIEIIKLTRGAVSPGIFMVRTEALPPALFFAVFSKAALALAKQLKKPVDIFHLFDWESSLVPLYLEMEKNGSTLFKGTRTFLNVNTLKEQGNFTPEILYQLGIPGQLFHPDGVEFYGKISYLKSGLVFSDGVGIVEGGRTQIYRNGNGMEGVLESLSPKLRRWASERSLRSHLDAYEELLALPMAAPLLPQLIEKLEKKGAPPEPDFVETWGPLPPDRYQQSFLSFLTQSPLKAYAFWEWAEGDRELGLLMEEPETGKRWLLGRNLASVGEFWLDTLPDREYAVELVGWNGQGQMETLLRSIVIRTPRNGLSPNTKAVFIDMNTRRRFIMNGGRNWDELLRFMKWGGTSAQEWTVPVISLPLDALPSSSASSFSSYSDKKTS